MDLYSRYKFFKEHAGQRALGAIALARAELWMENQKHLGFIWKYDGDSDLMDHEYWCKHARRIAAGYEIDGEHFPFYVKNNQCEHEIECCSLVEYDISPFSESELEYKLEWDNDLEYEVLDSLGGIIDADRKCKRVIMAELALATMGAARLEATKYLYKGIE